MVFRYDVAFPRFPAPYMFSAPPLLQHGVAYALGLEYLWSLITASVSHLQQVHLVTNWQGTTLLELSRSDNKDCHSFGETIKIGLTSLT